MERMLLIVPNTVVFMENRKLLFKQMASLSIHNQAFNEITQNRQGCRCVSPDHFGRRQLNCISIFVKSVPRCPPCPLFYLPSLPFFFFFGLSCLSGLGVIIRWTFPSGLPVPFSQLEMKQGKLWEA